MVTTAGNGTPSRQRGIPLVRNVPLPRAAGTLVIIPDDPRFAGEIFRIEKVNPTTYIVAPQLNRSGLNVKVSHFLVDDAPADAREQITKASQDDHILPHQPAGALVRWDGPKPLAGIQPGEIAVVLADKGATVNIAKIGGFGDRYGRPPRRLLSPATLGDILAGDQQ